MNESTTPHSNHQFPAPKVRSLFWRDLPDCCVLLLKNDALTDRAILVGGGRKQLTLVLYRDAMRGLVDVIFERGTVPSDAVLLALGRTIVDHLAAAPEWGDAP